MIVEGKLVGFVCWFPVCLCARVCLLWFCFVVFVAAALVIVVVSWLGGVSIAVAVLHAAAITS